MKQERSKVKSDILLRVRLLYVLFILAGAIVLARLVWVQLFSAEVAYNADRLARRNSKLRKFQVDMVAFPTVFV